MSAVTNTLAVLVCVWILVYITVYIYYFNSEDSQFNSSAPLIFNNLEKFETKLKSGINDLEGYAKDRIDSFDQRLRFGNNGMNFVTEEEKLKALAASDPNSTNFLVGILNSRKGPGIFSAPHCDASIQSVLQTGRIGEASIIMAIRNERVFDIVRSLQSIIVNSPTNMLENIIVVDDHSDAPLPGNELWDSFFEHSIAAWLKDGKKKFKLERLSGFSGPVAAKTKGLNLLSALIGDHASETHMVVFLDAPSVVSNNWLVPLHSSLIKYPHSAVYPAIDILVNNDDI